MFHRCRCFVIWLNIIPHDLLTFEITLPSCSVRHCSAPVPIIEKTLINANSEIANIGSLNTIENCVLNLHRFTEQLQNYLTSLFLYPGCICMYTARSTLRYSCWVDCFCCAICWVYFRPWRWDVDSDWSLGRCLWLVLFVVTAVASKSLSVFKPGST